MAQIAARALATFAVVQTLDAIYPGLGRSVAAASGVAVKHRGGVVGDPGPVRQVPNWLFADAPRYHAGGIVGLMPGEVPIIAQKGEEVLTASDPRHSANGGGQNIRIINAIDESIVQDFMSTAAGERVIVNAVRRNRGAVKHELA